MSGVSANLSGSSAFLAKTTSMQSNNTNKRQDGIVKTANSTKKRDELALTQGNQINNMAANAITGQLVNSQSAELVKGLNHKSKKQMLMLQLLQNFQDFGTYKKHSK